MLSFTTCLSFHLCNETELSISGGIVLPRSVAIISRLQTTTQVLDYKTRITTMYCLYHEMISRLVIEGVFVVANFDDTLSSAIYSFEKFIQCVQNIVVNGFHKRQNIFVQEKMKIIPSVLNLSKVETPTALC